MQQNELYHFGVKGMKWGVRKARGHAGTGQYIGAKRKVAGAKKDLGVLDKGGHLSVGLTKKRQAALDKRDREKLNQTISKDGVSQRRYESRKQKVIERVKKPLDKQKAQKVVLKGARVASKLVLANAVDDMFYGGAGKKAVKSAVKHTGRAVVSAWVLANGGSDIRWYDNGILD